MTLYLQPLSFSRNLKSQVENKALPLHFFAVCYNQIVNFTKLLYNMYVIIRDMHLASITEGEMDRI